ncbi:MAG TPA: immunoglobulin domain-containing protein, partial [Methylomirabilota bacterium]|nr:immunoglobulin domain-containing protein [Methylomirabilota bacterium]
VFFDGLDQSVVSAPVSTLLSQTPLINTYFRSTFQLQASPGGLEFFMTHLVDDGAVFYLNGAEFYRFNMPSGPVAWNTRPATVVGNVSRLGPIQLPIFSARQGSNILAAELHQDQAPDIDKVFGIQIDASVQSFVVGPVIIAAGPSDLVVVEGQSATFEVVQAGGLRFLWQSNSITIAGATNSFYTIPTVTSGMNGRQFRVGVSNAVSGLVFSTNATLRVVADTNPPALVAAVIGSNNTIVVSFNEPLAAATANNRLNYTVTNSSGAVVTVSTATLVNGTNVVLAFATPLGGRYTVVVNNVTDAATIANTIAPNSAVTVGADYSIAMDSAWRYLVANTNETVQSSFMGLNFNDSSWSGPSNALFYVEGAGLPGPKNTEITLRDGGNNYINTFYFRQRFVAPVGGSNVSFRIRHIIDDGLVLYLNGVEFGPRFTMAAGAVTAATQATAAVGDAALVGPYEVVGNLLGGTNVFAAEIHQNGNNSSDVVFGIEIEFSIPSVVIPPPPAVQIVTHPQSRTNAVGTTAAFTVVATGGTPIFYQWRKNGANILGATSSTLSLANVQFSDNGSAYTVVVTNSVNSVTSSVATLTVTNFGTCTSLAPNLVIRPQGTNVMLSWTNPTDSCGAAVPYILRSTTALPVPPAPGVWTTNAVSSPQTIAPTNTARFFQLIKQ